MVAFYSSHNLYVTKRSGTKSSWRPKTPVLFNVFVHGLDDGAEFVLSEDASDSRLEERLMCQSCVAGAEHEPAKCPCVKEGWQDSGLEGDGSRSRQEILPPCSSHT